MKIKVIVVSVFLFLVTFALGEAKAFDGQTDVELDKVWKVSMNQSIDKDSVKGKVKVLKGRVEVPIQTIVKDRIIYVYPTKKYIGSTDYKLVVQPGVMSTKGKEFKKEVVLPFTTVKENTLVTGSYTHTFESNYDFDWKYKKGDYSQFRLDGVKDGELVGGYTTTIDNHFLLPVTIGDTLDELTALFGKPVESLRKGNIIWPLLTPELKPTYEIGDRYVTFLIDQHKGSTIRAIHWVNRDVENSMLDWHKPYSEKYKVDSEMLMAELINQARHAEGLNELPMNSLLALSASKHSQDMIMNSYFDHTNLKGEDYAKRAENEGLRPDATGENITNGHRSVIYAHEWLMNSIGHRNNILYSVYKQQGVGVAFSNDSRPYVTISFYVYED